MTGAVYTRLEQRVLTGGWNLLPPGDLLGAADALRTANIRVDTAGNIRSRFGSSVAHSPGPAASLLTYRAGGGVQRYTETQDGKLYNGSTLLGDFGGQIGMVGYQGFLWAISNSLTGKDQGLGGGLTSFTPDTPGNPILTVDAAGGAGDFTEGDVYSYWVTYVNDVGQEGPSNPDETDITIPSGDVKIVITSPTTPGDASIIAWNVYRAGGTLEGAFRLNLTPIPLGTDWEDDRLAVSNADDLSVTKLGISLDTTSEGPPFGNGMAGDYYGHLLAWGVEDHLNRLYWSATLKPWSWPGASLDEGNHVDLGELGERIVGVTIRPRLATIYKENSIWRLVGDPDALSGEIEKVTGARGSVSRHMISVGGMDYFEAVDGLYSFNGDQDVKVSAKLDPLFKQELPDATGFQPVSLDLTPSVRANNCLAHRGGRAYFFYAQSGHTVPNAGVSVLIGAEDWAEDTRAITAIYDEGQTGDLLGSIGSDVCALEDGFNDASAAIHVVYQTHFKDQGAPDSDKMYADLVVEYNAGGGSFTVGAQYNSGASAEALGTLTGTTKKIATFQFNATDKLGSVAKSIALTFEGDTATDHPVTIYKIVLHYYVLPRDSKTFDSDETDFGSPKTKLFNELELDIDYAGASTVTWRIFTNSPGAAMASRDTNTIGPTTGRVTLRIPLAAGIEGRLARLTLRCDADTFKLYGARLRMLPYGEWYDGAHSEIFTTFDLGFGI